MVGLTGSSAVTGGQMANTDASIMAAGLLLFTAGLSAPAEAEHRAPAVDSNRLELAVASGKHDRTHAPVRVLLALPASRAKARSVELRGYHGGTVTAQLTAPGLLAESSRPSGGRVLRELHFVLPGLKAGETLRLRGTISSSATAKGETFRWHDTPGEHAELRFGSRPVLRYMYKALDARNRVATYKVFHHLYDPSGRRLVTKGPGGRYTHHRGLFYGFNKTTYGGGKKVDIWHCKGDVHQAHVRFLSTEEGPVLGRHRVEINWHGLGKEVFAREERELAVFNVPGGILVEFASRLRSAGGRVRLDGDPQHAGFQFRADNEVASKTSKQTYYVRPDGVGRPGGTRNWPGRRDHVNLPWNAMSFVLGGERYTAAYLDSPANPKEARFSERDYGRFGSYFEYNLEEGKTLDVNYRIWLQAGEMTVRDVAAKGADFTEPAAVTVR